MSATFKILIDWVLEKKNRTCNQENIDLQTHHFNRFINEISCKQLPKKSFLYGEEFTWDNQKQVESKGSPQWLNKCCEKRLISERFQIVRHFNLTH